MSLPAKMSSDHKALAAKIEGITASMAALKPGAPQTAELTQLAVDFESMHATMKVHLLEEEQDGLPALRHAFTEAVMRPVNAKGAA